MSPINLFASRNITLNCRNQIKLIESQVDANFVEQNQNIFQINDRWMLVDFLVVDEKELSQGELYLKIVEVKKKVISVCNSSGIYNYIFIKKLEILTFSLSHYIQTCFRLRCCTILKFVVYRSNMFTIRISEYILSTNKSSFNIFISYIIRPVSSSTGSFT